MLATDRAGTIRLNSDTRSVGPKTTAAHPAYAGPGQPGTLARPAKAVPQAFPPVFDRPGLQHQRQAAPWAAPEPRSPTPHRHADLPNRRPRPQPCPLSGCPLRNYVPGRSRVVPGADRNCAPPPALVSVRWPTNNLEQPPPPRQTGWLLPWVGRRCRVAQLPSSADVRQNCLRPAVSGGAAVVLPRLAAGARARPPGPRPPARLPPGSRGCPCGTRTWARRGCGSDARSARLAARRSACRSGAMRRRPLRAPGGGALRGGGMAAPRGGGGGRGRGGGRGPGARRRGGGEIRGRRGAGGAARRGGRGADSAPGDV